MTSSFLNKIIMFKNELGGLGMNFIKNEHYDVNIFDNLILHK